MKNRALTLSILMGVLAVFFVQSYVSSIEEDAKRRFGTEVMVIIAKRDIREMETITELMLDFKLIPKKFLEPSAISLIRLEKEEEQVKQQTQTLRGIAGSVAMVPIKAGEQLTRNKMTEAGLKTGLATQVAPGRRAISIPVNELTGVSKLVKPGDRVDILAVIDGGGAKENRIIKTLLQDIVVLSIGRYVTNNVARVLEPDSSGAGRERVRSLAEDFSFISVSLELDPLQAQMVTLLQSQGGGLYLSLRNNDDSDRVNLNALTILDILGQDASRIRLQGQAGAKK